jgi:hypothetical protein
VAAGEETKEPNMTERNTAIGFTAIAADDQGNDLQNLPPVADVIVNRKTEARARRAATASYSSGRRRFVDPATCERDYSEAEMEFMNAMQDYKQASGRNFPTWSEVLEVLTSLGYQKLDTAGA